jgi:hypothetical protein
MSVETLGARRLEGFMTEERRFVAVMIAGKSDEEITSFVETLGGTEPVLDLVFALMPQELDPAQAKDCVLGWEISQGGRTFTYRTEIKNGTLTAEKRAPGDAAATIVVSMPEFLRIIIEEVEAPKEYVLGKLKVRGDLVVAYAVPAMFPFKEKEAAKAARDQMLGSQSVDAESETDGASSEGEPDDGLAPPLPHESNAVEAAPDQIQGLGERLEE